MVASAAAAPVKCGTVESRTDSSIGINYITEHSVVGDGTVAPGGTVTLRTKVSSDSGVGALIDEIRQYHPAGFVPVSARVESHKVARGHSWVAENVVGDTANSIAKVGGNGWTTGLGLRYVTAEITYRAPANAEPGRVLPTGAGFDAQVASNRTYNPMDVCITIREPNALESAQGSLEGMGAGSLVEGSVSSANISSDPSGFVGEAIGGILGNVIGGAIGS